MAQINQEILKRTLVINVEDGTGADGTTKYKAKNFNGVKTDAALDKVYEAGTALGGLMEKPYKDIELTEKSELAVKKGSPRGDKVNCPQGKRGRPGAAVTRQGD